MSALTTAVVVATLGWVALFPRDPYLRVLRRFPISRPEPRHRRRDRDRGDPRPPGPHPSGCEEIAGVADMLAVALAAGAPVRRGVIDAARVLSRRKPGSAFAATGRVLERGGSLDDALDDLARSDPQWHHLATQLSISAQAGTPAAGALRRLARQERLRARRLREARARRLPVLLLLPLVTMVLPAFVLVTVVPFVVAGGISLELPPPPTGPSTVKPAGTPSHPGLPQHREKLHEPTQADQQGP